MFAIMEPQDNGLVLFKTTLLVHLNCKKVLLAMEGHAGWKRIVT